MNERTDLVGIAIDGNRCVGMGICEMLAPDAAVIEDDGIAYPTGSEVQSSLAKDMRDNCPSGAISILSD
ncbi:ferredoxin [Rhodococcus sp. NPDC059968]|uniref:ferredoxin n=1 Tax=Rhodococcus sp. NPDC059968 TaxID=3347017 RepID=UPI0036733056